MYMLLDTETIDLKKKYIYDIGLIIIDEKLQVIEKRHFIVKQIYDNRLLFNTAYYGDKRKTYVKLLKGKTGKRTYLGNAYKTIKALIKKYNIEIVFAFNSNFDKSAFDYTSKHLKSVNPFIDIEWIDIQALANHEIHNTKEFQNFCIERGYVTERGYLKANVEITYEFLSGQPFKESHIAIDDAFAELVILRNCTDILTPRKKKFFKVMGA